ncbi:2-hydroxyglutaryl-CoA dehydratase [Desulfosporosinus sp. HMP52]|uniref:acyl-CoA dehydratase activase n=1 Tax=Desulfosporosinus sp. HMP52 TaxID=1487923 RepID=UPI00051F8950|nr:acyl-CoA dehydratase activase [Desulfosporosinus sp. HMP52]KGK92016.1 2-hydroxyglutaryl-CoA dehydratase [Desulfosporosinus sp. HMP52]
MNQYYVGVDVGSVSTNIVLLDSKDNQKLSEALYIRTKGQPMESLREGFKILQDKGYSSEDILGVGVTGSARVLIGHIIGADSIKNEITAHAVAAINRYPQVKTVIEIGGQDSKMIILREGVVVDFAMNTICAAGTGSFLDQQAFRLNIPIEEFGEFALRTVEPVRIAGRCTVFAETDMVHKQQEGATKEQIVAGLCEALVRNYLNNVAKGKSIEEPVLFQGGVAFNQGIKNAFEKELGVQLVIPDHFNVMGALGSAILAKEAIHETNKPTLFKGFEIMQRNHLLKRVECRDCSNACELTEVTVAGEIVAKWGDRCGKWQK